MTGTVRIDTSRSGRFLQASPTTGLCKSWRSGTRDGQDRTANFRILKHSIQSKTENSRSNARNSGGGWDRVLSQGATLLASEPLQAYRRVRNKLIAHTEVHKGEEGLKRYPIENLRLKFGTERELLRNTIRIVHELQSLVCDVDFSWDSLRSLYERDAAAFWEVAHLDDLCP
jgi:hypothetical protein